MKPIVLLPPPRPAVTAPRPVVIGDDVTAVALGSAVRLDVTGEVFGNRVSVILTPEQARRLALALSSR